MSARALILTLVVSSLAAGDVLADPPAEKPAENKKAEEAEKAGPVDLQVKPQAARINLFPTQVFQKRSTREKQRRMTLGDDGNWKVQAAQVGAMVGIFGALVGLCGGGKCLIPDAATDVLPDWMKSDEPVYSNPRESQPVRSAR